VDTTAQAEVRARVQEIVASLAPAADATPTPDAALVADLGYHSLALLELAFALEDEYGLPPLSEEVAQSIRTVADIEDYVVSTLAAR